MEISRQLFGEELIDMYYIFKDAALFHITPSIQEISFEFDQKRNLHVFVHVLKSIKDEEIAHINEIKSNLEKHIGKSFCYFSILKIEKNEMLYAKRLKKVFFSSYREEDYESFKVDKKG